MTIRGYAAVFYDPQNQAETEFDLGQGYVERMMPGCFDESLASGADVVGLFNHDPNLILGRRSCNTLYLEVDRKGLRYHMPEASTSIYKDVQAWQERRELTGSSFGFTVTRQRFTRDKDKNVREIQSLILVDVGPCTFPAYSGTGNGIMRRCVNTDGRCTPIPHDLAGEFRSAIQSAMTAMEDRHRLVEVRARAIAVDTFDLPRK